MKIKWYGTAALSVKTESSSILIDPYIQPPGGTSKVKPSDYSEFNNIVCTHSHFDHIASIPKLCKARPRVIYGTDSVHTALCKFGVAKDIMRLVEPGVSFYIGDIRLTAYRSQHVKYDKLTLRGIIFSFRIIRYLLNLVRIVIPAIKCTERRQTVGYLVEAEGKRIFVLGSLSYLPEVRYPEAVDLLVLPYQGTSDLLTPAKELIALIKPKAVLLDHFDDAFPPLSHEVDTSDIESLGSDTIKIIKPSYFEELTL